MIFNIMSLLFGVIAIIFPIIGLTVKKSHTYKISCISFSMGILSLYCQICEYNRRVGMQDWSALLDTSKFTLGISFALMIITLVLNVVLFKKRTKKK
ncbi:MAG: hypothetical protein IKI97_13870 [Clostridia bacterium]|nr:hypothetical protein [Clostridia bacterium]